MTTEQALTTNRFSEQFGYASGRAATKVKNYMTDYVQEFIRNNLPMGRFGWPEPVGALAAFLASAQADLITGACINIDGGQSKSLI